MEWFMLSTCSDRCWECSRTRSTMARILPMKELNQWPISPISSLEFTWIWKVRSASPLDRSSNSSFMMLMGFTTKRKRTRVTMRVTTRETPREIRKVTPTVFQRKARTVASMATVGVSRSSPAHQGPLVVVERHHVPEHFALGALDGLRGRGLLVGNHLELVLQVLGGALKPLFQLLPDENLAVGIKEGEGIGGKTPGQVRQGLGQGSEIGMADIADDLGFQKPHRKLERLQPFVQEVLALVGHGKNNADHLGDQDGKNHHQGDAEA